MKLPVIAFRWLRQQRSYALMLRRIERQELRYGLDRLPRRPKENRDHYLDRRTTQIELAMMKAKDKQRQGGMK